MKMFRILCVSAAILIPQLVLAKLPFPNDAFGKVEGILDFCAKADPQSAAKYQAHKKALVKDVPEKEVAEARQRRQLATIPAGSQNEQPSTMGSSGALTL